MKNPNNNFTIVVPTYKDDNADALEVIASKSSLSNEGDSLILNLTVSNPLTLEESLFSFVLDEKVQFEYDLGGNEGDWTTLVKNGRPMFSILNFQVCL